MSVKAGGKLTLGRQSRGIEYRHMTTCAWVAPSALPIVVKTCDLTSRVTSSVVVPEATHETIASHPVPSAVSTCCVSKMRKNSPSQLNACNNRRYSAQNSMKYRSVRSIYGNPASLTSTVAHHPLTAVYQPCPADSGVIGYPEETGFRRLSDVDLWHTKMPRGSRL